MKTYVYVIECRTRDDGPIKIGYTSNLKKRLGDLQVGNPFPLVILGAVAYESEKAAAEKEAYYHKKFKRDNMRGEWFQPRVSKAAEVVALLERSYIQQREKVVPDLTKLFLTTLSPQTKKQKRKWARKKGKK